MFYVEKDNTIVLYDTDKQRLQNTLDFKPDLMIEVTKEVETEVPEYDIITETEEQPLINEETGEPVLDDDGQQVLHEVEVQKQVQVGSHVEIKSVTQMEHPEIKETEEGYTILNYEIVSVEQAQSDELEQAKEQKLAEALEKAYEYENKTGFITFDGRPVKMQNEEDLDALTPTLSPGRGETMALSVELFNQSKFFQMVIGFAQGLLTDDFIYSTKEDVVVYINEQEAQGIYYAITEALSKLWTVDYVKYKRLICSCQSVDAVESIVIDYSQEITSDNTDIQGVV